MIVKHRIRVLENVDKEEFLNDIYPNRLPVILRGINVGPCLYKWNVSYLSSSLASEEVRVHVCDNPLMNFVEKNFLYRSLPFDELLKRASEEEHDNYFISKTEFYYLRSLGKNQRKDVADIKQQFPDLAEDVDFPSMIPKEQIFSSVFRIASAGLSLWTHYDIMDNMLIQITGKKRAVLFPPEESLKLYLNGDKSEVLDIDNPDLKRYPKFASIEWHEAVLEKGDILFIPALWFHNMKALEFGVAINVFWKNLDEILYDKKDPYGNKDLLPAQRAFLFLDKALAALNDLPDTYRIFYHQRMVAEILKRDTLHLAITD